MSQRVESQTTAYSQNVIRINGFNPCLISSLCVYLIEPAENPQRSPSCLFPQSTRLADQTWQAAWLKIMYSIRHVCANAFLKHLSYWSHSGFYITLTFDHHHIDVYGADGRLGQTLTLLQDVWNLTCGNPIVGLSSKRHQLPDSHSWMNVKHNPSPKLTASYSMMVMNL